MAATLAVWHTYANGEPFGRPAALDHTPTGCSCRLHTEEIDPEVWEILADRQHELHESMMEEFEI